MITDKKALEYAEKLREWVENIQAHCETEESCIGCKYDGKWNSFCMATKRNVKDLSAIIQDLGGKDE